jgi:hypothetical protein
MAWPEPAEHAHMNLSKLLALLAIVGLVIISLVVMLEEGQLYLPKAQGNIIQKTNNAPFSVAANKQLLDRCVRRMSDYQFLLGLSGNVRAEMLHCHAQSLEIAKRLPTYSYAWMVVGFSATLLEDESSLVEGFQRSYLSSPNQLWIARLRVLWLIERAPHLLSSGALATVVQNDISVLIVGNTDWNIVATLYLRTNTRQQTFAAVRTLPFVDQMRFLEMMSGQRNAKEGSALDVGKVANV